MRDVFSIIAGVLVGYLLVVAAMVAVGLYLTFRDDGPDDDEL